MVVGIRDVLRVARKVAEAHKCDACRERDEVMFIRPASATERLAGFRLALEENGVRLVGEHAKVPKHIVKILLATLHDEFGLTPQTKELLERLQNG